MGRCPRDHVEYGCQQLYCFYVYQSTDDVYVYGQSTQYDYNDVSTTVYIFFSMFIIDSGGVCTRLCDYGVVGYVFGAVEESVGFVCDALA